MPPTADLQATESGPRFIVAPTITMVRRTRMNGLPTTEVDNERLQLLVGQVAAAVRDIIQQAPQLVQMQPAGRGRVELGAKQHILRAPLGIIAHKARMHRDHPQLVLAEETVEVLVARVEQAAHEAGARRGGQPRRRRLLASPARRKGRQRGTAARKLQWRRH